MTVTVRCLFRSGLLLGLTFFELEFCGSEEAGEPGVLRSNCAEEGYVPHGPVFLLSPFSSPTIPRQQEELPPRVGWVFLFKTRTGFPLLFYTPWLSKKWPCQLGSGGTLL